MIYSRSAEYAIRSFVYLARIPDGKFAMARHIAKEEQIPAHFLAKILQELTRKGLLRSNKGPSGGFSLRVPAGQIRLLDLVEALDGPALAESLDQAPWILDSWETCIRVSWIIWSAIRSPTWSRRWKTKKRRRANPNAVSAPPIRKTEKRI